MNRNLCLVIVLFALVVPSFPLPAFTDDALVERLALVSLRQEYADPTGQLAEIGGVEVYYKDQGEGPAILMIHRITEHAAYVGPRGAETP